MIEIKGVGCTMNRPLNKKEIINLIEKAYADYNDMETVCVITEISERYNDIPKQVVTFSKNL